MIEFDFQHEKSPLFGVVFRPVARVFFRYGDTVVQEVALIDSGADMTILPRRMGEVLGFPDPVPGEIVEMKGVSGHHVPMVVRKAFIQIGDREFHARVGWCLAEEIPVLLGRLDLFEFFDLIFKRGHTTQFIW